MHDSKVCSGTTTTTVEITKEEIYRLATEARDAIRRDRERRRAEIQDELDKEKEAWNRMNRIKKFFISPPDVDKDWIFGRYGCRFVFADTYAENTFRIANNIITTVKGFAGPRHFQVSVSDVAAMIRAKNGDETR